ncbi:hypothetical protein [Rhodanobacter denitrificans]|uniref:hypothetical protein n=1 Tax=Rhodanobacter denitrificans TaxID=666685 RepID=UPI00121101DA|nr:hypothetical protein [Rhodanobacter denitrificans]TAM60804.1 MAG: hypothetical protein EPN49_08165 [Rhodanobacter sp.]UJJ59567.1 hypothetical protein LRK55_05360 [Rhodanobacter denitrificans]
MTGKSSFSGEWIVRFQSDTFIKEYRRELSILLLVFAVVFSQLRLGFGAGPAAGVEQWVNLTNQMFYGKQDFLFSYGPLYWITGEAASQYSPITYWVAAGFLSLVYATFWTMLFSLAYRAGTYILFATGYFLFFYSLIFPAALFLWPLAAIFYMEFANGQRAAPGVKGLVLLGLLTGLFFYIRYFYGLIALVTFGSYFFSESVVRRKWHYMVPYALGASLGYLFFGLLIFHQKASLLSYLVINNQLNFGNSVDMTLDVADPLSHLAAAAVALGVVCVFAAWRRRILFLTVLALSLIFLKMGFSRLDHYIGYFVVPAAVLTMLPLFSGSKLGRVLYLLATGCLYFMQATLAYPGAPTRTAWQMPVDFGVSYADRMQTTYGKYKLDAEMTTKIGSATIDVYPYNNEYIFANKLNYLRRPLFQSYMTLTPILDSMNARFFESKGRPKFVLWTAGVTCWVEACNVFDDFDGKFSLNEDPLTTSAILLNYHIVGVAKGYAGQQVALFEENSGYEAYSYVTTSTQAMKLGAWYKVPRIKGGVIKLAPKFSLTLVGRLKNLLFHGGVVTIQYKLASGEVIGHRLNILNAANGIWVSPLPKGFDLEGDKVDSVMLDTSSTNYLNSDFEGTWGIVPISSVKARKPAFDTLVDLPVDVKEKLDVECDGSIDALNGALPASAEIKDADGLLVQGWLAYSAKRGVPFDRTVLTLTDDLGRVRFVDTHIQDRPDVARAFKQPGLSSTGFKATVDLTTLDSSYKLGLAGIRSGKLITCRQFEFPVDGAGIGH